MVLKELIRKMIEKFEKKILILVELVETNQFMYNIKDLGKKSRYMLEDRGTDRQPESISECTLKDFSNDIL